MAGRSGADLIPRPALARVPGCGDGTPPLYVAALAGGAIHRTWRVDTGAGRFVVRVESTDAEELGADRLRERRLQALAAARGLAPQIVADDPEIGVLVMEYVDARTWSAGDLDDPRQLRRLGATLAALHAVQIDTLHAPSFRIDIGQRLTEFAALVADAAPAERCESYAIAQRAVSDLHASRPSARAPSIVHDDLHHANILDRGTGPLVFVDWEYAAIGDPLLDLASVLAYHPPARAHAVPLLESSGLGASASLAQLLALTRAFDALVHLWYRVRRVSGAAAPGEIEAEAAALRRLAMPAGAVAGESRPTPAD